MADAVFLLISLAVALLFLPLRNEKFLVADHEAICLCVMEQKSSSGDITYS